MVFQDYIIPAGVQLNCSFEIEWFVYGIVLTVTPIVFGFMINKFLNKYNTKDNLCIICGGMTSTPAVGILLKNKYIKWDLSVYSFSYIGALLTVVIGIKLI